MPTHGSTTIVTSNLRRRNFDEDRPHENGDAEPSRHIDDRDRYCDKARREQREQDKQIFQSWAHLLVFFSSSGPGIGLGASLLKSDLIQFPMVGNVSVFVSCFEADAPIPGPTLAPIPLKPFSSIVAVTETLPRLTSPLMLVLSTSRNAKPPPTPMPTLPPPAKARLPKSPELDSLLKSTTIPPATSAPKIGTRSASMPTYISNKPVGSDLLTGSLWQRSPIRDSEPPSKNVVLAFSGSAGGSDAGAAETSAAWFADESRSVSAAQSESDRNIEGENGGELSQ